LVTIHLPPLRERMEDIALLTGRFLDRLGPRYTITNEALDAMLSYDWPGNVRELQELHRAHGDHELRPAAPRQ